MLPCWPPWSLVSFLVWSSIILHDDEVGDAYSSYQYQYQEEQPQPHLLILYYYYYYYIHLSHKQQEECWEDWGGLRIPPTILVWLLLLLWYYWISPDYHTTSCDAISSNTNTTSLRCSGNLHCLHTWCWLLLYLALLYYLVLLLPLPGSVEILRRIVLVVLLWCCFSYSYYYYYYPNPPPADSLDSWWGVLFLLCLVTMQMISWSCYC